MQVRVEDNVRAQYKLVTEKFGIRKLKLVIGWAMGAGQAFQWAVSFPDMVERILPFCGSARTSPHNVVSIVEESEVSCKFAATFKIMALVIHTDPQRWYHMMYGQDI